MLCYLITNEGVFDFTEPRFKNIKSCLRSYLEKFKNKYSQKCPIIALKVLWLKIPLKNILKVSEKLESILKNTSDLA